jgi:hypothetical protein
MLVQDGVSVVGIDKDPVPLSDGARCIAADLDFASRGDLEASGLTPLCTNLAASANVRASFRIPRTIFNNNAFAHCLRKILRGSSREQVRAVHAFTSH